jgi:hypothetical protein
MLLRRYANTYRSKQDLGHKQHDRNNQSQHGFVPVRPRLTMEATAKDQGVRYRATLAMIL